MIQIGTSLASSGMAGASGNPSADSDRVPATRLFGPGSVHEASHNFHVNLTGAIVHAFGLTADDKLTLQMVVGCKEGDLFEDVCIRGAKFELTAQPCNNVIIVPLPGRYRLLYSGSNIGGFYAFYYNASLEAMQTATPILAKLLG